MANPLDIMGILGGTMQGIGSIFGGGGEDNFHPVSREAWQTLRDLLLRPQLEQFNQFGPEYQNNLRNAMQGNMGLDPKILQNMFGQAMSELNPQFRGQRTQLQASFNPRMQGSGAVGKAMADLLGQQSQQTAQLQGNIQGMDLMNRAQNQSQALGQQGDMWANMLSQANNAWMNWLGASQGLSGGGMQNGRWQSVDHGNWNPFTKWSNG